MADPQPNLRDIIRRAKRLTKARGMKSKLAGEIHVPRQLVSAWLSGENEPSGANALALRNWVFEAEAEQNADAGGAETPPAQKTQIRKNTSNEKPNPSRRKK